MHFFRVWRSVRWAKPSFKNFIFQTQIRAPQKTIAQFSMAIHVNLFKRLLLTPGSEGQPDGKWHA